MASVFGHAVTAITGTALMPGKWNKLKMGLLASICSIFPDADVIMFRMGFSYDHWLGHRGFFHSLVFALFLALLVHRLFYSKHGLFSARGMGIILFFFTVSASHGILDAMTTGGRGVAFFSPFDNERYFLPWRFITVSPLGAMRFFSDWGLAVLKSELIFIGVPCLILLAVKRILVIRSGPA